MKRRPRFPLSDRTLEGWLETGRPRRVTRQLEWDDELHRRLETLSGLDRAAIDAVHAFVEVPADFVERTSAGVHRRLESASAVSVLADLAGLGFRTGQAFFAPQTLRPEVPADRKPE